MLEDTYDPAVVGRNSGRFVVISGCSGAGKSSLLAELECRGHRVYEETGRQVVKEQLYIGGDALPWEDREQFRELTISRSIHQLISAARFGGLAFFDRGIIDQIAGYAVVPRHLQCAAERFRYHDVVFLLPPWPEIFQRDAERRHSFADAVAIYGMQRAAYRRFGYDVMIVPQSDVAARADFVLANL
jgi:predicted ATPase